MGASILVIIFFMLATVAVLVAGLVVMAIGGKLDRKWSNRLMVMRVIMQSSAILLLALMFMSR